MNEYDAIIIGAGPAGLTAGLYLARARLRVLLLEKTGPGGQIALAGNVENYPGFPEGIAGLELSENMRVQAEKFGLKATAGLVEEIKRGKDKTWHVKTEEEYKTFSAIIASGASYRKLGVGNEEKLTGRGVSYCATCDGAFFRDKNVVVVGGGDQAVEEALFLTNFARKVTIIHRRDRLRAAKILQERALSNKKMEFVRDSVVEEIGGREKVEGIRIRNVKTGKESELACDGVFVLIGLTPDTGFLKGMLELDDKGYIVTDEEMKTSEAGIFACGDCRKKRFRQVVTACGDGATAAFSAQQYVEELKGIAYK